MSGIYTALPIDEIKATLPVDKFKVHYPVLGFQVAIPEDLYKGYLADIPISENTGFPYTLPFILSGAWNPPAEN